MTSYQVTCSVTRPPDPTSLCHVTEFQDKAQNHMDVVFHDIPLSHSGYSSQQAHPSSGEDGPSGEMLQPQKENLMMCAVVSKTSASFSGADNFQSRVKLPFFWCNLCPFDTESRASLLQHVVSQHCFACHFCSFVALTRGEVIHHGLAKHPQFLLQFREQRLKACQLKRDMFQLHFKPESQSHQNRKRRTQDESDVMNSQGLSRAKQNRLENADQVPVMKMEQRGLDGELNSSSSDSIDDIPMQFSLNECREDDHGNTCEQNVQLTTVAGFTHVMENIVSSSGMEPDMGVEKTMAVRSDQAGTSQPQTHTVDRDFSSSNLKAQDAVAIKQESDNTDEDFAHALGKNRAEDTALEESEYRDDETSVSSPSVASIQIKQEPVDPHGETIDCVAGLRQDLTPHYEHICNDVSQQRQPVSRSSASPPLSHIRVETLQEQFEQSFREHTIEPIPLATADAAPHPVQLITQTKKVNLPELVENFLIDSAPSRSSDTLPFMEESEGQSSASMLRHLLTRPYQEGSHGKESSETGEDGACTGSQGVKREDHRHSSYEMRVRLKEKIVQSSLRRQLSENFLLIPGREHSFLNTDQSSKELPDKDSTVSLMGHQDSTDSLMGHHSPKPDAPSAGSHFPFIKQEPEDDSENDKVALMSSFPESNESHAKNSADVGNIYPVLDKAQASNQTDVQETSATMPSVPSMDVKLASSLQDKEQASASLLNMSSTERMKYFSNMSLRDLLTMQTDIGPGLSSEEKPEAAVRTREGEGEVVWECGFCHFEDIDKSVVLFHRQEHHAQHMAEAGLQDDDFEICTVSNIEGKEQEVCEKWRQEGEEHTGWIDQHSMSAGHNKISQELPLLSPQRPGPSGEAANRTTRVRGSRQDDDFDYMSEEASGSDSSTEPEDLEDENYVPPRSLFIQEEISSEDETYLSEKSKKRKVLSVGKRWKGRPLSIKNPGEKPTVDRKEKIEESSGTGQLSSLYSCPYCDHVPGSAQKLKDHIRNTSDSNHLLIILDMDHKESLRYVCPGDACDVSNAVFADCQSYLVHVMQCQGHMFDAHKPTVNAAILAALNKADRLAGFLNCPISNCYYVSYLKDHMHAHLAKHVQHLYSSQMLLFRSVCTAMAKVYAGVHGFDRYVCYRCSAILMDLPHVLLHMKTEHEEQVRGVLLVTQKLENNSRGIIVAIQCLACRQRVPSLEQWFCHRCKAAAKDSCGEDGGTSCSYQPKPSVVNFEEWFWRMHSSGIKIPAVSVSKSSTVTTSQGQLPLIRSILLAQPAPTADSKDPDRQLPSQPVDQQKKRTDHEEDDDVTPMIHCDDCQGLVPETEWKHHECFVGAQKKLVPVSEQEGDLQRKSSHSVEPASATNNSPLSRCTDSSPLSRCTDSSPLSRSRLLAALAPSHQSNLYFSHSRQANQPATTSHPSLVSLLTCPGSIGQSPSGQSLSGKKSKSQREGGMIRSLLAHSSKAAMQPGREEDRKQNPEDKPGGSSDVILCEAVFGRAQSVVTASAQSRDQDNQKLKPDSALSLQKLLDKASEPGPVATFQSSGTIQQPLMSFLRQQGNQMMQVLGNVLGNQEGSSSS